MDTSKPGLSSNSDLFISVAPKTSRPRADTSSLTTSENNAGSRDFLASNPPTTTTSIAANTAQLDQPTRRIHRYTITALSSAPVEFNAQSISSNTSHSQIPVGDGAQGNEGVTASQCRESKSSLETSERATAPPPPASAARADASSGSTARSISQNSSSQNSGQGRNHSPLRQNMGRARCPRSSYRGPGAAVKDETYPAMNASPSIPPPLNKETIDHLVFGKLTLHQRSRAIDAPPSPHKPSGISRLVRRLSGNRKSTEASRPSVPRTPTKPLPITPAKPGPTESLIPRTDSYSSIPTASTPYSSPDPSPSPQKLLKSRRRTPATGTPKRPNSTSSNNPSTSTPVSSHSRSASTTTTTTLPDPEIAYAETHYFSACPHTSPPSHRPLNIPPAPTPFATTTLKYPPFNLRARLAASTHPNAAPLPTISVISRTCAECDWKARRQQEGEVLAKYADIRNNLLARIKGLRHQIACANEAGTSSGEESDGEGGKKMQRKSDVEDGEEAQDLELEMLALESEIEELPEKQDGEVKQVWRGWAGKWGPGTVGVHRSAFNYDDDDDDDGDVERGEIGSETTLSNTGSGAGSGSGSGTSLTRSTSSASAFRGGLNRWGGQVDDVVAEGRMRLDWIRPDLPKVGKGEKNNGSSKK